MILVVDHDPEVLERAREILNRDRQVFLASSAEKAFDMVTRQLGFSVVLVDLDLPGDPYALMRRLHKTHPDLMIIAVGGGAKTPAPNSQNISASSKGSINQSLLNGNRLSNGFEHGVLAADVLTAGLRYLTLSVAILPTITWVDSVFPLKSAPFGADHTAVGPEL